MPNLKAYGNLSQSIVPTPSTPQPIKCNLGNISYGQYGKNLFDRPDGSYTESSKGSIVASNQIITINYGWNSAWTIYKLSGAINSQSIATSLAVMKSYSGTDILFENGKTYIVKLFDSTTDYYDLQISNTTTNKQIQDGVAFTPTDDFNALWVRTQQDTQQSGNHTFKLMIVEGSIVPTEYEQYHLGFLTDGEHKLFIGEQGIDINNILPSTNSYVDIQQGKLYKDWAVYVITGNENITSGSKNRANVPMDVVMGNTSSTAPVCYCNYYELQATFQDTTIDGFNYNANQDANGMYFKNPNITTLEDWKAYFKSMYDNGTPIIVAFPLKTPTEETITTQPISLTTKGAKAIDVEAELICDVQARVLQK